MGNADGEDEAERFGRFYDEHVDAVYGFLRSRCPVPRAEELTADVFVAACQVWDRGAPIGIGWLMTVAQRRVVDHWRHQGRVRDRLPALVTHERCRRAPDAIDDADTRHLVHTALDSMPDRHRRALVLRYLDDLPVAEVAGELGISLRATESLLARARRSFSTRYTGPMVEAREALAHAG